MKKINRVIIAIGVVLLILVFYEVRVKPQSRPLYERALTLYHQQNYAGSLLELERAYEIEPNSTAILTLMGWDYLKLRQYQDARANFSRALRLNPNLEEPRLGLAYVALETGSGEVDVTGAHKLLEQNPGNFDFRLAAAEALRQDGRNLEAQKLYTTLLNHGKYGELARKALEEMYGVEGLNEKIPEGLPPYQRPGQLRVDYRSSGAYLQRRTPQGWEDFYVKGINLGPGTPGHYASDAPSLMDVYVKWLGQIAELGANTIRVHAPMPPAFYRALKRHNETSGAKLYLLQQIWLVGPDDTNLFDTAVQNAARQEVARVIDLIHGQGDLPMRRGRSGGMYVVDVSDYVVGLLVGRELEPHLVLANNEFNSPRRSYSGKYVSLREGNATEVWLAGMLDHAAGYEQEKYNAQRPLSIVNWPPLDPLAHPTEAGLLEEMKFRQRLGERVGEVPKVFDDDDTVSVDSVRFHAEGRFQPGLFAAYSVYPFYPDFLLHEPGLLQARDQLGPNSYFGYLKALKAHYSTMPLVIVEYGIPTSIGIAHFQPQGWNQGGLNERQQGEALARMTGNIADAGCAGGLLFEWQDEWYKSNWMTRPFEIPEDRRVLWLDELNPQESFGIWTYEPSKSRLFSSDPAAWRAVKPLYEKSSGAAVALNDGGDAERTLRGLAVNSDEAFVYVRLRVESLPRTREGAPQLDRVNYLIGINTRPGSFGGRLAPGFLPYVKSPEGLNFLLHVGGVENTRLLVTSNYNPYGLFPVEGAPGRVYLGFHHPWKPALEDWSPFEEIEVEANRLRFSRDGNPYPAQRYSRSLLRYGTLDPNSPQYDSLATWSADFQNNALIFRIPWGLLFVTDPSSRQVYGGTSPGGQPFAVGTEALAFFALSFRPAGGALNWGRFPSTPLAFTDSLPTVSREGTLTGVQRYTWEGWNKVELAGRLKAGARAVQKSFKEIKVKG